MINKLIKINVILLGIAILSGCFGSNKPTTSILLISDQGDYIGQGNEYEYSNKDSLISISHSEGLFSISVAGDENWRGSFQLPSNYTQLEPGIYESLTRYPFHDDFIGGLSWSGEGRGCNQLDGWIIIEKATYVDTELTELELQFEQHCEGAAPALYGEINWYAADDSVAPGPSESIPADAWQAPIESLPLESNYIYLESEPGDYIGAGNSYLYSEETNSLSVSENNGLISVSVDGWFGSFKVMNSIETVLPGYYGDLQRYPFHNPVKGGLTWYGNGRGCNQLEGWFIVDHVYFENDELVELDLRFEQHCEGLEPALNGQISWYQ